MKDAEKKIEKIEFKKAEDIGMGTDKVEVTMVPGGPSVELELDQIGVPASDFKRAAILVHLVDEKGEETISELKKHVEENIKMPISDGTFRWHVERLRSVGVIQFNPARGTISPTESGEVVAGIIRPAYKKALSTIPVG